MHGTSSANGVGAYSAEVRLTLVVGEERLALAQVSRDWVRFDRPVLLQATSATLEIEVDGVCDTTRVELETRDAPSRRVHYALA